MMEFKKLNYNETWEIIKTSKPEEYITDTKGNGFWLLNKEIQKSPESYLSLNSPWKPEYYGLFENNDCKTLAAITYNNNNSYKNYPYILIIQSLNKSGNEMFKYLTDKFNKEGYKGMALMALNNNVAELYKNKGFKEYNKNLLQLTWDSN